MIDVGGAVLATGIASPVRLVVDGDRLGPVGPVPPGLPAERSYPHLTAIPGFIDLQVNGWAGASFGRSEAEPIAVAFRAMAAGGTTSCCPTIVTAPASAYARALQAVAEAAGEPGGCRVLGTHLEGPFLNPTRIGAHSAAHRRDPDVNWALDLVERASVPVAIWTLAPELPGAAAVTEALVSRGVRVSAGHTDATYDQMLAAVGSGVSMVTHLFNAMRPLHHRDPGVVGAALDLAKLHVGIVGDGLHVVPAVRRAMVRVLGRRAVAVSDAVAAAGTPGVLADPPDVARLADGTIAGSLVGLAETFRALLGDHGLEAAVRACSEAPAAALGRDDIGILAEGALADVVLVDRTGTVCGVVAGGRWVKEPSPTAVTA